MIIPKRSFLRHFLFPIERNLIKVIALKCNYNFQECEIDIGEKHFNGIISLGTRFSFHEW